MDPHLLLHSLGDGGQGASVESGANRGSDEKLQKMSEKDFISQSETIAKGLDRKCYR